MKSSTIDLLWTSENRGLDVRKNNVKAAYLALFVFFLARAQAATISYDISLPTAWFGDFNQNFIPGWGGVGCGPTAAMNSFAWLENKYPNVYSEFSLIPDDNNDGVSGLADYMALADILGGADYMNTIADGGTYAGRFAYGKWKYLEKMAPGKTRYEAQSFYDWSSAPGDAPPWFTIGNYPTPVFIGNELNDGEDVELQIEYFGGGAHYLTLTSFHWTDGANGNSEDGRIQFGENATVDYIDPLTGKWAESAIWQNPTNSRMELDYGGGAWVSLAVSESPVPEPSQLVHCAAIVAFGLLIRHRTKRSQ